MKNLKKYFSLWVVLILIASITLFSFKQNQDTNYVPDAETAKKIAEAIWLPIYGESVLKEKPYNAELKNGVWIVTGYIGDQLGGYAYIEIQKSDCKVLKVEHGK